MTAGKTYVLNLFGWQFVLWLLWRPARQVSLQVYTSQSQWPPRIDWTLFRRDVA